MAAWMPECGWHGHGNPNHPSIHTLGIPWVVQSYPKVVSPMPTPMLKGPTKRPVD